MRTQDEIARAFEEGGSVLLHAYNGGMPITRPEEMPSVFELAADDPDQQSAIIAQMEADLAARAAELDALKAAQGKAELPEPDAKAATEPNAETKAALEKLTKDELLAEAKAANITLPADVTTKAEIVAFLLNAQG